MHLFFPNRLGNLMESGENYLSGYEDNKVDLITDVNKSILNNVKFLIYKA